MKKVLIITYYWPPAGGGGVQRWLKFAKYLPNYRWEPIIYTPKNPEFPVRDESLLADVSPELEVWKHPITEPYSAFKKFSKKDDRQSVNTGLFLDDNPNWKTKLALWVRGNVMIPDARVWWVNPSVKHLSQKIKKAGITHMVTTGPPHSMHLIGLGLKKKFPELKWLVDYRDPWTDVDYLKKLSANDRSIKRHQKLEKNVLAAADEILTVSPTWADDLKQISGKEARWITNGYDEDDFTRFKNRSDKNKIRLIHTGIITSMRNPKALWQALDNWLAANPDKQDRFELRFAGTVDAAVQSSIARLSNLAKHVQYLGYLSHQDVIKEYETANGFLLLLNQSENAKGHIPGKFFEYAASGKPIFGIGHPDSDVGKMITTGNRGELVKENDPKIGEKLINFLDDHPSFSPRETGMEYSRKALTVKLKQLLNAL